MNKAFPGFVLLLALTFAVSAAGAQSFQPPLPEWKNIVFGQSITLQDDTIVLAADGSFTVSSLNGKGKVTGAHDGIAFRYLALDPEALNFSLSADVEVLTYANDNDASKPKPNNQEAFGLMVRDAIGADGDASVFASNMVYVGGYRSQTQAVIREGVEEKSGAGARQGSALIDAKFPAKGTKYRLSVRKTNSGYHLLAGDDTAKEVTFYRPRLMQVQDKRALYLGFFAARSAAIKVSNIALSFSDPKTDPPAQPEPPRPATPALSLLTALETSSPEYSLVVQANVDGALTAKGASAPAAPIALKAGAEASIPLSLRPGDNPLDLSFLPAEGQSLSSAAPVLRQLKFSLKAYGDPSTPILVSPAGKPEGDGSAKAPLDLATAIKYVQPGQTISLAAGTYKLGSALIVQRGNDGRAGEPKTLAGPEGGAAVLSFEDAAPGIQILGDHWLVSDLGVTKSTSTGIRIGGMWNQVLRCAAFANGNTGIQISGSSLDPRSRWPAYNAVVACLSYDNIDAAESDADGFAAKLTVGQGNGFFDCVSRNNCDDGWDLYTKLETGPIPPVVIERCVAYGNGILSSGRVTRGDGNGFKLGGEGIAVRHLVSNCVSFGNKTTGFTSNSNPAILLSNCAAADNGGANFALAVYAQAKPAFVLEALRSVRTAPGPADIGAAAGQPDSVYLWDGKVSKNAAGRVLGPEAFLSTARPGAVLPKEGGPDLGGYLALRP